MRSQSARAVLTALVLVGASGAGMLGGTIGRADGHGNLRTPAANRRAAIRDAGQLLGRLTLPSSAVSLSSEPSGDGGVLARPAVSQATPVVVDQTRWWRVPGAPDAVLAFVAAHSPAGGRQTLSGSSGGGGGPSSEFVELSWPAVSGILGSRSLVVQVVSLSGGGTGVRADAQVVWIVPRAATEKVPSGVREVDVTRRRPGQSGTTPVVAVSDRRKVGQIVSMIDQLPIVQPGASSCPAQPGQPRLITFTFRASPRGPALAAAEESADASAPSTPCEPLSFAIRGQRRTPLLQGATFLRRTQRLLGVTLISSPQG